MIRVPVLSILLLLPMLLVGNVLREAHASILSNGSFEVDSNNDFVPDDWDVTGNVGRSGVLPITTGAGGYALDGTRAMIFSSGNQPHNGVIQQTFMTDVGSSYEVSFGILQRGQAARTSPLRLFASALDINDLSVLGSVTAEDPRINASAPNPVDHPYLLFSFQFTATSSQTRLRFADDISIIAQDNADLLLDDVQVTNLSAVPEPTSVISFSVLLFGVALAVRQRRRLASSSKTLVG